MLRISTDDYGLSLQQRVILHLDGGVETIHVEVKDDPPGIPARFFPGEIHAITFQYGTLRHFSSQLMQNH
jgi:hypothetical protein